jgi:hypothetical protein
VSLCTLRAGSEGQWLAAERVQIECFIQWRVSLCPLIGSSEVQGECKEPPSEEFLKKAGGPLLEELLPGQCVILDSTLNPAIFSYGSYVVDNMYIRHVVGKEYSGLASTRGTGAVFLINSTFDAATSDRVFQSTLFHNIPLYVEGALY